MSPYIKQEDRESAAMAPAGPGELNFALTNICVEYWADSEKNYAAINEIIGALEGAKLEFYRRVVSLYEDEKILENGDVYFVDDD